MERSKRGLEETTSNVLAESGLIAIALVIRSKDGPRFVFHYPEHPTTQSLKRDMRYGTELDEESDSDDYSGDLRDADSDLEDGEPSIGDLDDRKGRKSRYAPGIYDEHYDTPNGEHIVPWEHIGEFETTDLESILTPSRLYHKKKFELSLDPLHFVTYPMHIREDGLWKKKRTRKAKSPKKEDVVLEERYAHTEEKEESPDGKAPASEDGEDDHGGMTMFNVVFMLSVPKEEEDERIWDIYEHVIKKFNKALKHAQAGSNYVWRESEMILSMKAEGREDRRPASWLWPQIIAKSTLASAIQDVYIAISTKKISTFQLATTPPLDISLQIPVPSFLTSLPSSSERAMPGLLVTTANPLVDDEGIIDPAHLNKHFALLLLNEESKIIAEIQADNTELSAPLIECIRLSKPHLSFLQVAQQNSVELPSLLILAQHLIYWRRAIAIPPLHARETYVVSPNCDTHKLPLASIAWKNRFPLAPALSSFLSSLSAAPRPYKSFFPSKNHRAQYLEMLGWLIRGGWVTQLRTFAWILVWPEIIYEVAYHLEAEDLRKKANAMTSPTSSFGSPIAIDDSGSNSTSSSPKKSFEVDPSVPLTTEQAAENARLARLATKAFEAASTAALEFSKKPVPVATTSPSINNAAHLRSLSPYIITDPHKVSHEESLYIAAIGKRFAEKKISDSWFRFAKYFNGTEALEGIGLREGMKRKEAWGVVSNFGEWLVLTKHW